MRQAPVLQIRESANRTMCCNNLKQIGLAVHHCQKTYNKLPPAIGAFPNPSGNAYGSIQFHLLPFLEQDNLYKQTATAGNSYNPQNNNWNFDGTTYVSRRALTVYTRPSDPSANGDGYCLIAPDWGAGCYADNFQVFAPENNWGGYARMPASLPDGISNTLLFAERYASCDDKMSA